MMFPRLPCPPSALVGTLVLLPLAGCASTPRVVRPDTARMRPPAAVARQEYDDARALWREGLAAPDAETAERALGEAARQLDLAAQLDPASPLYPSKAADLRLDLALGVKRAPRLLEAGPARARAGGEAPASARPLIRAAQGYRDAVDLSVDWIPAHLGLARIALLEGDLEAASRHTRDAERSLERVRGLAQREPTFFELAFGLDLSPVERIDPMGPVPEEGTRTQILGSYLAAGVEGWRLEGGQAGSSAAIVDGTFRRLQAEIVLLRARIRARGLLREQGPLEALHELQRGIDAALEYDFDFFEARLAKARASAQQGDVRHAAELLEPYLEGDYPLIERQLWILAFAARCRLEAFATQRDFHRLELARQWLSAAIARTPESAAVLELRALRAELLVAGGQALLEEGLLAEAEGTFAAARADLLALERTWGASHRHAGIPAEALASALAEHKALEQAVASGFIAVDRARSAH